MDTHPATWLHRSMYNRAAVVLENLVDQQLLLN